MQLRDLHLRPREGAFAAEVASFIEEAERRIEAFACEARIPGFVPSDFRGAYQLLHALADERGPSGSLFCEWGSGFGVVACLAAMVGFDACGIEIEAELVEQARQLAADFGLAVPFFHGSFIPRGATQYARVREGFSWLRTEQLDTSDSPEPSDFDVIFAYPWPSEKEMAAALFARYAREGAVLITYHGGEEFRVRRKMG